MEREPASGVAPSRSAIAILHGAFCASSVGDLCISVQYVPVPGPPALSMVAFVLEASRCVFSKLAPPPQQTGSSIVTLQTPCPMPGFSAGPSQPTAQEPVGRSQPHVPPCLVHQVGFVLNRNLGVIINSNPHREQVCLSEPVTSSGWAPWSCLPSTSQIVVMTVLCKSTANQLRCLRRKAHLSNPDAQDHQSTWGVLHVPRPIQRQHFRGAESVCLSFPRRPSPRVGPA